MIATRLRRSVRFSLRKLFVAVTVVCVLFGWIGSNLHQVRARKALLISDVRRGAGFGKDQHHEHPIPLVRRILGDFPAVFSVELPSDKFTRADRERLQALFPEVSVVLVDRAPLLVLSKEAIDYAETH